MVMINYLIFIGTAIILFISFRAIRMVSHRVQMLQRFYPMLVAIELSVWIAFVFWLINRFLQTKAYYNELVLVLVITSVVLLVWYYIKDVIAGFIFRIKHNPKAGQHLQSIEANGVIKRLAVSQLFVEGEGREVIRIPYSKLLDKSLSLDTGDSPSASEAVLQLNNTGGDSSTFIERKIRIALLQSPWCVPGKPIRIKFLSEPKKVIEITLHLIDRSFVEAAKNKLEGIFNKELT